MNRKITDIQRNFLKRLLMSKAGLVVLAFKKMQNLPDRKNHGPAIEFEKRLTSFIDRTLRSTWKGFRNEFE